MTKEARMLDKKYSRLSEISKQMEMCRLSMRCWRSSENGSDGKNEGSKAYEDKLKDYEDESDALEQEMQQDFSLLRDMKYQLILRLHYIDGMGWRDVGSEVGHEERYTRRLRDKALEEIVKKTRQDP